MGKKQGQDLGKTNFEEGLRILQSQPLFYHLERQVKIFREDRKFEKDEWAYVSSEGLIYVHPKRVAEKEEWVYVLAHCLLHLGFGHFKEELMNDKCWNIACDCMVTKFLQDLKIGKPPMDVSLDGLTIGKDEASLYRQLKGMSEEQLKLYQGFGTMGQSRDLVLETGRREWWRKTPNWKNLFAKGLNQAVRSAIQVAAGYKDSVDGGWTTSSLTKRVKEWFVSSYPLLGALASNYTLIEDAVICQRMQITVAAISPQLQEIYINPAAGLTQEELQFVMAHEFLHVALRHEVRCMGRDFYLWNVACDYVINGWLQEMQLGDMPSSGLYDEQFRGLSAESIYDRIVTDIRRYRKLATLRGVGIGDILPASPNWWNQKEGTDLDEFYRTALLQGLEYHLQRERGYLPADMIEEIRALAQPPIPWDVELAKWFDEHFMPLEKKRTYARLSRRQSATPDIPRPSYRIDEKEKNGRTFAVLLDTSGSMERRLLAQALGAIASYSIARDVHLVRVIFCDAMAYDQGMMAVEDIAGRVKVRGRGGTVLQPGIDLLQRDAQFPKEAPLLIITDGGCDVLNLKGREHAYLMPAGARLPFVPKGKVFRIAE